MCLEMNKECFAPFTLSVYLVLGKSDMFVVNRDANIERHLANILIGGPLSKGVGRKPRLLRTIQTWV
jgi:hypothetical protein